MRLQILSCVALLLGAISTGCTTTRVITVSTKPADATIKIDDIDSGRGPLVKTFVFNGAEDSRRLVASRPGYKDLNYTLTRDYLRSDLLLDLKPETRRIVVNVLPVPANISVDGKPLAADQTTSLTAELEYAVDAKNSWIPKTLVAERPGYQPAQMSVGFRDREAVYVLRLEAMRKDLSITSAPAGAAVYLDGEMIGTTPVQLSSRAFPVDITSNEYIGHELKLTKAGYDPVVKSIAWDDGRIDYHFDIAAKTKQVRIRTDPPGGTVTIDNKPLVRDSSGVSALSLDFPPVNENGELKSFKVVAVKKTADSEWEPKEQVIAWDNGKTDYTIPLKEILTRPVTLMTPELKRGDNGWTVEPVTTQTLAMKDTSEASKPGGLVQITKLAKGSMIDTLTVSPDGQNLLFTVISGTDRKSLRSQMMQVRADGTGGASMLSDGKTLDLMPSYSPGGDQIYFSSNRNGPRMSVCFMATNGAPGITQLTSGDTNDLWPSVDGDPKPRLFYQAMVDTRSDPRLFMSLLGSTIRTDLIQGAGMQPRVSPRNDAILFSAVNESTSKRDIYRMADKGGQPENLTIAPDTDEFDATWSRDGSKIAFVSDRGQDAEQHHNCDIWVLDTAKPDAPVQITANGSRDDCPVWDPTGQYIYFRSNRGGEWAIWRVAVK